MANVTAYHRPQSVEEALGLLNRAGILTRLLAGGTALVPQLGAEPVEVVDLQAAGLDGITEQGERLEVGALTTLATLVADERVPVVVRETARREGPNTFRHQGSVAGALLAADGESEFVAALLLYGALVTIETPAGAHRLALDDFLAGVQGQLQGGILVAVELETAGSAAADRVARTPEDKAIVAALARTLPDGTPRLALSGVARRPILTEVAKLDELAPPGDFRGSGAYRKEMARVLAERVLARLERPA